MIGVEGWRDVGMKVGISDVVQVVVNVLEVRGGRPAAKNFYCVVEGSQSGSGEGGSDAE